MGILNLTPDSFSDGGEHLDLTAAVRRAFELFEEGATIIDIGGESTRPGALPVPLQTEIDRVAPVLKILVEENFPGIISIDTYKPEVARLAIERGAEIINDVTGLKNPKMLQLVIEKQVRAIVMHMRGMPATMQQDLHYHDVVTEVREFLRERIEAFELSGGTQEHLMVDPGIGFGKSTQDNLELTHRLGDLKNLDCPIVYGASRKKFLGDLTGKPIKDRDEATAVVCAIAIKHGASILRVHNPKLIKEHL
jgi:dihydropteroate synthase